MKKFFLIALVFLPVAPLFSQTIFGIKGGLNLAKIHIEASIPGFGSGSNSSDNLTSFHAGLYMRARLGTSVSIQPELIYSGQGGTSQGSDLKLDYLNLPVMLLYHANEQFSLQAGPQLGFILSTNSGSVSNDFNAMDFGLALGAGYDFTGGPNLTFRYVLGLTNITKIDTTGAPAGTSITTTNQVIQFSIGFKLSK
ncbi:MAG: PorT family protein [Cyclobacteriaceae bacterium]|nr:PorT family protein [Cyclobacteriaceae bacterium]